MSMEKQKKLVRLLIDNTSSGKLDWQTTFSDEMFHVSLKNKSVGIEEARNRNGASLYRISLMNEAGEVVETFSDEDLDDPESAGSWFGAMGELYNTARRTARGAEKLLNEIIDELDDSPF